jgi:hypothetical protein
MVSPVLGDTLPGPTYWDTVFELGYDPDSGRAFGFLPLWLIDMLIPSNIEKITSDFFQALATGNDGQGAIVEFTGQQRAPLENSLEIRADAEALSNGTIKLGFNLQRRFAREQQKLITELKAFNEQLWNAFYRDYQKVKHKRGCQLERN